MPTELPAHIPSLLGRSIDATDHFPPGTLKFLSIQTWSHTLWCDIKVNTYVSFILCLQFDMYKFTSVSWLYTAPISFFWSHDVI